MPKRRGPTQSRSSGPGAGTELAYVLCGHGKLEDKEERRRWKLGKREDKNDAPSVLCGWDEREIIRDSIGGGEKIK